MSSDKTLIYDIHLNEMHMCRLESTEIRFRPGLRPGQRCGSSRHFPRLRSRLGWIPSPFSTPDSTFSAPFASWTSMLSALPRSPPNLRPLAVPSGSLPVSSCPFSESRIHQNAGFCIINIFLLGSRPPNSRDRMGDPYQTNSCAPTPKAGAPPLLSDWLRCSETESEFPGKTGNEEEWKNC